jgi:urease accessory protein
VWFVPLTFLSAMAVGGLLGMTGVSVPFVEQGILVSVLVLGVFIAAAARLPLVTSVVIIGLFAILHGHAHGAEMPQTALDFAFGAGFMLATALLHAVGIGIALIISRIGQLRLVRFAGGAIALCGVYLCFA